MNRLDQQSVREMRAAVAPTAPASLSSRTSARDRRTRPRLRRPIGSGPVSPDASCSSCETEHDPFRRTRGLKPRFEHSLRKTLFRYVRLAASNARRLLLCRITGRPGHSGPQTLHHIDNQPVSPILGSEVDPKGSLARPLGIIFRTLVSVSGM